MMLGSKVLLLTPFTVIQKPLYVPHFFLKSLHNLPYSNGGAILYLSNKGDKHKFLSADIIYRLYERTYSRRTKKTL